MLEALFLKHIAKTTQNCRLSNVNISVAQGAICSVLSNNDTQNKELLSLLTGESTPDSGQIFIDSKPVKLVSRSVARRYGVRAVYASNHLFLHNSIAENLLILGYSRMSLKYVNHRVLNAQAERILAEFGFVGISASMKPYRLSDLYLHMLEILRAYTQKAKLILIENITTNYTDEEMDEFLRLIDHIRQNGVSIVLFLSRYSRVLGISDSIVVFRNGTTVYNLKSRDAKPENIALALSGYVAEKSESPVNLFPVKEPLLSLRGVSNCRMLKSIDFDLRQGEILGLMDPHMDIGVELVNILTEGGDGVGRIEFNGSVYNLDNGDRFPRNAIAYIAENTAASVVFDSLNLFDNVTLTIPPRLVGPLSLNSYSTRKYMFISAMKRTNSLDLVECIGGYITVPPISTATRLRILFARCLCSQARVIIVLDTQSNRSPEYTLILSKLLKDVSAAGTAIIIISNDVSLLSDNCNRTLMVDRQVIT